MQSNLNYQFQKQIHTHKNTKIITLNEIIKSENCLLAYLQPIYCLFKSNNCMIFSINPTNNPATVYL